MLGLGLDYGLGFSSDIRLRQDPQLRVSHLATSMPPLFTSISDSSGAVSFYKSTISNIFGVNFPTFRHTGDCFIAAGET